MARPSTVRFVTPSDPRVGRLYSDQRRLTVSPTRKIDLGRAQSPDDGPACLRAKRRTARPDRSEGDLGIFTEVGKGRALSSGIFPGTEVSRKATAEPSKMSRHARYFVGVDREAILVTLRRSPSRSAG